MDFLLLKNPETLKRMSIEKRAEEKVLPEELSINDIARLRYPNDESKQKALKGGIIEECKAKKLTYCGDINGWTWGGKYGANPHPKITNGKSKRRELMPGEDLLRHTLYQDDSTFSEAGECLIHRDNFKHYLESMNKWTGKDLDLLANWWTESEPQATATGNDSAGSQAYTEPVGTKVVQGKAVGIGSKQHNIKTITIAPVFSKFLNLRANEISLVIMKDKMAKMLIRGKSIKVHPDDLGLKADSQDWKLLEGAAVNEGSLANALKKLNSSSNLEAEKGKIKTAVSRLRKSLIDSIGLKDNPIKYMKDNNYKFTFKAMTHELLNNGNVSKGSDAMDYVINNDFDNNQHGVSCWDDED